MFVASTVGSHDTMKIAATKKAEGVYSVFLTKSTAINQAWIGYP
jgi:hypothetical protein